MRKSQGKNLIPFKKFPLPILIVLFAIMLLVFGATTRAVNRVPNQLVLSEDDSRDSDEEDNDNEDLDDDEEDEEDNDLEDQEEEDDDDRDDDGQEVEFEYKTITSGTSPELSNFVEAELEQEIELNSKLGTTVNKVELEVESKNGEWEYEGSTYKDSKLFGIFDVSIPMGIEIDPNTGQIISVNQTFWSKLLDFLSL